MLNITSKGVIFDWDNTIFQSGDLWEHFALYVLQEIGINEIRYDEDQVAQMTITAGVDYLRQLYNLPYSTQEMLQVCMKLVTKAYSDNAGLTPGLLPYLAKLQQDNVKMCVATASDHSAVTAAARNLGIDDYFEFIMTETQAGRAKADGGLYLAAAEKLALAPADCIVFDDAPYAIAGAKQAGFRVCGVGKIAVAQQLGDININVFTDLL